MTPTLESALAGLPAKPRVHELSKRIGITNKELLAALAERGLTISSASSSVPLPVAQEVIQTLLGGADTAVPADSEPASAAEPDTAESAAGDSVTAGSNIPGDSPSSGGHAINPLFLPPADAPAAPARSSDTDQPDQDRAELEADADAPTGGGRRRRGRSGKGRRSAADRAADQETAEPTDSTDGAPADATPVVETDTAAPTEQDGAAPALSDESDDESSARGRRRRRGRRGRGRVGDSDNQSADDGPDSSATDATQGDAAPDADDAELLPQHADAAGGESAETSDDAPDNSDGNGADRDTSDRNDSDRGDSDRNDADSEQDSDDGSQGGAGGNRRRRRRRRRTSGDETPREDDPDNTVVHVREPRLSQAATGGSTGGSNTGASDEVQGVRGSTRLEAKRQRRRDSRDSSRRRPQILTEAEFLARRESVERVMAVRQRGGLAQVALLEDGILVEHFVSQTGSDSMIGSVFLGKVQNVLPSMEAAFVDIGRGRNAVIYAGEVNWDAAGLNGKARRIETALSSGDTILAQVSKDPVGHKGARLTTQISLPGRFVVYVPGGGATGISRKLPDTERKRLKSIMDRIVPEDAGVIIRTAAEGIAEEELARDVERLKSQWEEISRRASEKTSAPTQLYAEPGTLIKVVRDLFNSDITRLVVDGDEAYEPVADYVNAVAPELADRLVRYESATPGGADVFAAYRIDEQIAKALERKVHLPSGGSLVIDRTEAMTVVDVNTGKYTGSGGNLEETVTKNNLEAAEEMVRQLRLRDIGGIIVIDFIDMVLESNRELVLRRLTEALGRDRTRHQVAEVTSLGLVQMTRKRMGTGLVEAFSEPCPHCGGRGIVLHDLPVVASPAEENSSERRTGKARRSRGRDSERVEEIVVPRVVEQTPGRRPDPRGPKPPSFGSTEREPVAAMGIENEIDERPARDSDGGGRSRGRRRRGSSLERAAEVNAAGDEIDWIEAAARAGIAAADAADSDDEEFGHADSRPSGYEGSDAGSDGAASDGAGSDGAASDGAGSVSEDLGTEPDGSVDAGSADGDGIEIIVAADDVQPTEVSVTIEPVEAAPEAAAAAEPAPRRRGRRAAGRPAGAPAAASGPVDIIVPEAPAASAASGANGAATAGSGSVAAGSEQSRNGEPADVGSAAGTNGDPIQPAAPAAPPRRRRAASRPAGPAAGPAGDALVVTLPAETPTG
ncbi:Rne/Rng family ribonuclease [Nakamurella sp. GG22]